MPLDDAVHPGRVAVDPVGRGEPGGARQRDRRVQVRERHRPLVAPDLEVHVHHVVVRDRQAAEPVRDGERPQLGAGVEVPDDPHALARALDPVCPGPVGAAELRVGAGLVAPAVLAHAHTVDALALAQRDVAVGAAEGSEEVERDLLADEQGAVPSDAHGHVRLWQRVVLGLCDRRRGEKRRQRCDEREGPSQENCTCGTSRAESSASKYTRGRKLKIPAITLVGTVSSALSYESTVSL